MSGNGNNGGWQLDRRISWGHVVTTIGMILTAIVWSVSIQGRVELNEERISINARDISNLRADQSTQYTEIIRRLERLNEKSDKHLEEHSRNGN